MPTQMAVLFETLRRQFFEPLARSLTLSEMRSDIHEMYAVVSGAAGNVRVHFESDRGLCTFAVGSASDDASLCAVDVIARRFPRVRQVPQGEQRLTLEEQAAFISEHWRDLQTMFSPEHIRETISWRRAAAKAYTKRFT